MKPTAILLVALSGTLAYAQTTAPRPKTSRPAAAAKAGTHHAIALPCAAKLPATAPAAAGPCHTEFTVSLRYKDLKVGTGPLAEPGKLYKVYYTGYLASDGTIFDSTDKHRRPVLDKDNKPVNGADGKPELGEPEPFVFPQGSGRLIPGWDQGFEGMHVGGKRRLFIPYRLAYGELGRPPVIPPKADLVFDIELLSIEDVPQRPMMGMPQRPAAPRPPAPGTPAPGAAPAPSAPQTPPTPPKAETPSTTEKPSNPAQPQTPQM
jgi:peptidylprolyl isomerase